MAIRLRTPLAWKNLAHKPRRLIVATGGIAFAVLLMFMQTGFRNALLDSTVKVIDDLDADIVIVSKGLYALPAAQRFSHQRIYQARACAGVQDVQPVYIETFYGRLKQPGHKGHPIRVLACDVSTPVLPIPQLAKGELDRPGTALIDTRSKAKFGVPRNREHLLEHPVELTGRSIQLVGTFRLGADFANDGNLIMSSRNFAEYFPQRASGGDPLGIVDIGVVRVRPGADLQVVKQRLREALPNDVAVLTKREFAHGEKRFWNDSTPVGYIFAVGTVMGFIVGVVICYQIIYSNIADHTAEFATLKAMGYRHRYFVRVVFLESFYLSLLGFVPGLLISLGLYYALAESTGLLMVLDVPRIALIYVLTIAMCSISGCLAMRKVMKADPAELF